MAALTKTSKRSTLSAGILAYRKGARGLEVLLIHSGRPFWRKKDDGAYPSRRAKSMPRKIQSRPREVSLPRNSAPAPRLVSYRP
jgi:hypothetical protein